jgi:hypothetical protein
MHGTNMKIVRHEFINAVILHYFRFVRNVTALYIKYDTKFCSPVSFGSPIPVAEQSYDRSFVGIAGSNPAGVWKSVSRECCVLSGRGLCDGPIIGPEEPYGV